MKPLLRGERLGSLGVVAGLFAVLCLLVGLLLFIIDLRGVADQANKTAASAAASERALRRTILDRCQARLAYDNRFIDAARGDQAFYDDLLALTAQAEAIYSQLPPEQQAIADAQKVVIQQARERKAEIVAGGVIGNCEQYADEASQ